uniref:Phosphoprotein n=1 Tax=Merida virus TaxID=1803034 RepID=A0A5Q0TW55_9RHAB|nr:hypothetical protein [Merida virus]
MSGSGEESDRDTKSREDLRAESFYSVGSDLPKESLSCLSSLLEYNQEGLEKAFSEIDLEDPLTGEGVGDSIQMAVPWGKVSKEKQAEYLKLLRSYDVPSSKIQEEDTGVEEEDRSDGTPSLPPTSPSSEGSDRPLSPFLFSDEEYSEYVDISVPEVLQDVALRTPLMSLLRDVVRVMVNSKDEPLFTLQKYDIRQGTVRLARVGNLYTYCSEGTPIPVLEQKGPPTTQKHMPCSTSRSDPTSHSVQGTPSIGLTADPTPSGSKTKDDTVSGQATEESQTLEEIRPPSGPPLSPQKGVTVHRAMSPSSSSHYSQTSSRESSSDEEEEIEVMQETYTFICPIYGSSEMSVKVFPGHEVEPLIKGGMVPPEIFRAILRDRGLLRALEAVLDIGQTHMT